ncbi:MAG TPA: DUF6348 family protein [Planktothrix sp.]|jgi:hypothetical protein
MELIGNTSHLLAGLLHKHGIECTQQDGLVTIAQNSKYKLALEVYRLANGTIQLDAIFSVCDGKGIRESLFGTGNSQPEAIMDAQTNFVICVFHVWLAALFDKPNEYVDSQNWTINGVPRSVTIGGIACRGSDIGQKDLRWQHAFHSAIQEMLLAEGTHWIDFYYGQNENKMLACQVWLDNEPCPQLQEIMTSFDWHNQDGLYTIRQFMILKGGFDCAESLPFLVSDQAPERIIKNLCKTFSLSLAERYVHLGPIAFGRRLMSPRNVKFAQDAVVYCVQTGNAVAFDLNSDWIYSEMERISRTYPGMMSKDLFDSIATTSAEAHVLLNAIESGHNLDGASFSSPMIPLSKETFELMRELKSSRALTSQEAELLKQVARKNFK